LDSTVKEEIHIKEDQNDARVSSSISIDIEK